MDGRCSTHARVERNVHNLVGKTDVKGPLYVDGKRILKGWAQECGVGSCDSG
jgi:hypothetical protein